MVSRSSPRHIRNRYVAAADLIGFVLGLCVAYSVRFEALTWPPGQVATFLRFLPLALAVKFLIFYRAGLYRRLWRHAGVMDLERIAIAGGIAASLSFGLGVWLLPLLGVLPTRVPLSVAALDGILTPLVAVTPRFLIRVASSRGVGRRRQPDARRVLIAGAGSAGEQIAKELRGNPELGLTPVGFVDDNGVKHGLELSGLPILGPIDRLPEYCRRLQADRLIVAMPSATGATVRRLVRLADTAGVTTRTIPSTFEILSGRVQVSALRPIQIEDLLRREPVRTDLAPVGHLVRDATVLVTGAGGSIGAELCRQVAALRPARLIIVGHGENSIFDIDRELRRLGAAGCTVPRIVDVRNVPAVGKLMGEERPKVVLHNAAHKHVPLMEDNVAEAITNNVFGTKVVATAAVEAGADCFVMVSTDKAVRPTSVMGASKRVAEQVVRALAERSGRRLLSVRFGNVLGSRGSVVPIFLEEIERGGPVRVTHPEMQRYFMTIPEAVQLTLQAAVVGGPGDVLALDMGAPIRIADLAADMIRLSGLEPGRDVEIIYTGARPGEKLHEELFFGPNEAEPTNHPKILKARRDLLPPDYEELIDELIAVAANHGSPRAIEGLLRRLVPDYRPSQVGAEPAELC